jgi:predicted porin
MKKSLLALAVAAAIPALAQAQASNVIMYGRIDLGYNKTPGLVTSNGAQTAADSNCGKVTVRDVLCQGKGAVLNQSQQSGSRFGVRGAESLGGGLFATFQIEHRFNADTGAQSNFKFWQGRSIVGLRGGFGEINLGHNYTPLFWTQLAADPWGWDTVAQTSNTQTGTQVRFSNSLEYVTPSLGGLQGRVMWAPSEVAGTKANFGLSAVYNAGPLYVGLGYENHGHNQPGAAATVAGTVAGSAAKNKAIGLTASYNLGFMKLIANAGKTDVDPVTFATANADAALRHNNFSAVVPLGAGEFRATVGNQSGRTVSRAAAVAPAAQGNVSSISSLKTRDIGIGYHHNLSNRTTLYVDLNRTTNTAVLPSATPTGVVGLKSSASATQYDFGVKHNF